MSTEFEKDFDDEVYEDSFYGDEEELEDDDDLDDDDDIEGTEGTVRLDMSFACDDCDYRWDDSIVRKKGEEDYEVDVVCPMCGSMNVTQI